MKKPKKEICANCGKKRNIQHHHTIRKCEGGTATIPLCRRCHIAEHVKTSEWAKWGQKGGKQTASNPEHWKKNLKQFRESIANEF